MAKAVLDQTSEEDVLFINHFPVEKRRFMRYAAQRSPTIPSKGTIILLSEWGTPIEANTKIISALNKRGFHVIIYDWYTQGTSKPELDSRYETDFRFNPKNLSTLFHTVILPDFPCPFYVFAQSTGGLFALTAHDFLRNLVHRMLIVSPLLEAQGHRVNGLYHQYMRMRALFSLKARPPKNNLKQTDLPLTEDTEQDTGYVQQTARLTPQWYKTILNAAAYILSPTYCEHMVLPTLFVISTREQFSDPRITRELTSRLRMAESITISGAKHDILNDSTCYRNQFWKAFDTFIPGTGAPTFDNLMENRSLL